MVKVGRINSAFSSKEMVYNLGIQFFFTLRIALRRCWRGNYSVLLEADTSLFHWPIAEAVYRVDLHHKLHLKVNVHGMRTQCC